MKTNMTNKNIIASLFAYCLIVSMPGKAELQPMAETELASHTGQAGISIEVKKLRINADDEGNRTKGFHLDYVTKEHNGDNESHYFANEVSLAIDTEGALTIDIEGDGALVIGLPDRINYVGDGYSQKGIFLNQTGNANDGGMLYGEQNIQGNFDTGGTITMWGSD